MAAFDPRSIILIAGILGLVMAVVLAFLRRSYPPSIAGLGKWSFGMLLAFVAAVLFGARNTIPDVLSVVLANFLLVAGGAYFYYGTQCFLGRTPATRRWTLLASAMCPVLAWFTYLDPNFGVRIFVANGLLTAVYLVHCVFLWRYGTRGFARNLALSALCVHTVLLAIRSLSALTEAVGGGLLERSTLQNWYVAGTAICLVTFCIGAVLMAADRLRSELERLATRDSLTGALARGALLKACQDELSRIARGGPGHSGMALMMVDLDHFKQVNDQHGHLVGDRVLSDFAERVHALLRPHDRFGRYGGEEFVVLLPDTTLEAARAVADRIQQDRTRDPALPATTVSIGITASRNASDTLDAILGRADTALYQAKDSGRDRSQTLP